MIVVIRFLVIGLSFSWFSAAMAATWYDVNGDGKEGLAETIHSLQVGAGLVPAPPPGTFTNIAGMQFRLIPAGTFIMGSPDGRNGDGADTHRPFWPTETGRYDRERQHIVTITKPYYVQITEVTQAEWNALVVDYLGGENPSDFVNPDHPVNNVSWYEAASYANWLSTAEGLTPCYNGNNTCTGTLGIDFICSDVTIVSGCNGYKLPTEAQWEYAARAGTITATINGNLTVAEDDCDNVGENINPIAWYCANSDSTMHPVGTKEPNPWGLYDMAGNVSEWCEDWYGDYPDGPVLDPLETDPSGHRIVRGGSWFSEPRALRSAYRGYLPPSWQYLTLGFRLVIDADSVSDE